MVPLGLSLTTWGMGVPLPTELGRLGGCRVRTDVLAGTLQVVLNKAAAAVLNSGNWGSEPKGLARSAHPIFPAS